MPIPKQFVLAALFGLPLFAAPETWNNVPLVDANCSAKVKANPDAHTRSCALQCSKSGYGILAADGTFLRFDSTGNDRAMAALQGSQASDHLRVTVTGDREDSTIKVKALKLQ
jgi:hypothetical protein